VKQLKCSKGHILGIAEGDKFCFLCGSPVSEFNRACECGKDPSVNDRFCPNCGRKVEAPCKTP
jgi:predicted amidophosphoribosyltransferase